MTVGTYPWFGPWRGIFRSLWVNLIAIEQLLFFYSLTFIVPVAELWQALDKFIRNATSNAERKKATARLQKLQKEQCSAIAQYWQKQQVARNSVTASNMGKTTREHHLSCQSIKQNMYLDDLFLSWIYCSKSSYFFMKCVANKWTTLFSSRYSSPSFTISVSYIFLIYLPFVYLLCLLNLFLILYNLSLSSSWPSIQLLFVHQF